MKKNILILLMIGSLFVFNGCKDNDDNDDDIVSKIKAPAYTYEEHNVYLEEHDEEKALEAVIKNSTGNIETRYEYIYDNKDRNIRTNAYDKDDKLIEYYVYEYDTVHERKIKKGIYYNGDDEIVEQYETAYNSAGNYTETIYKDGDGNIISSQTSTYDPSGEYFILESYYDKDGLLVNSYEAVYDGNWIELSEKYTAVRVQDDPATTDINEEVKIELSYNFFYNVNGLMYMQTFLDEEKNLSEMRLFEYNENGSTVKESFLIGDKIQTKEICSYDEKERYTEVLNYNYNYEVPLQAKYVFFYDTTPEYDIYKYDLYIEENTTIANKREIKDNFFKKNNKFKKTETNKKLEI